jgi:hypothetical protein
VQAVATETTEKTLHVAFRAATPSDYAAFVELWPEFGADDPVPGPEQFAVHIAVPSSPKSGARVARLRERHHLGCAPQDRLPGGGFAVGRLMPTNAMPSTCTKLGLARDSPCS